MIFYSSLLSILKLEGAISIGFIIGFLSFIPYLGSIIGLSLTLLFALLQFSDLSIIFYILGIFIIGQFIESKSVIKIYIEKCRNSSFNWYVCPFRRWCSLWNFRCFDGYSFNCSFMCSVNR